LTPLGKPPRLTFQRPKCLGKDCTK
jgi:hypothetical protein